MNRGRAKWLLIFSILIIVVSFITISIRKISINGSDTPTASSDIVFSGFNPEQAALAAGNAIGPITSAMFLESESVRKSIVESFATPDYAEALLKAYKGGKFSDGNDYIATGLSVARNSGYNSISEFNNYTNDPLNQEVKSAYSYQQYMYKVVEFDEQNKLALVYVYGDSVSPVKRNGVSRLLTVPGINAIVVQYINDRWLYAGKQDLPASDKPNLTTSDVNLSYDQLVAKWKPYLKGFHSYG